MTVKELILKLLECDPNALVAVCDNEGEWAATLEVGGYDEKDRGWYCEKILMEASD